MNVHTHIHTHTRVHTHTHTHTQTHMHRACMYVIIHYMYLYYVYTYVCITGEPLSTVGVDLGIWKYRKDLEKRLIRSVKTMRSVTFYTWDFGGQVSHCYVIVVIKGRSVKYV